MSGLRWLRPLEQRYLLFPWFRVLLCIQGFGKMLSHNGFDHHAFKTWAVLPRSF